MAAGATAGEFKVVILGTGGVGKSAICQRYVSATFSAEYDPTIEDRYKKRVHVAGIEGALTLNILDTAGQAEFSDDSDYTQYMDIDAFIMVYSVTSEGSFHSCNKLFDKLVRAFQFKDILTNQKSIIIVANKCDIPASQREVTEDMGKQLSKQWNTDKWIETSAKENTGIDELFEMTVNSIAIQKGLIPGKGGKKGGSAGGSGNNSSSSKSNGNSKTNSEDDSCCAIL